jgi:hypothetical protein
MYDDIFAGRKICVEFFDCRSYLRLCAWHLAIGDRKGEELHPCLFHFARFGCEVEFLLLFASQQGEDRIDSSGAPSRDFVGKPICATGSRGKG